MPDSDNKKTKAKPKTKAAKSKAAGKAAVKAATSKTVSKVPEAKAEAVKPAAPSNIKIPPSLKKFNIVLAAVSLVEAVLIIVLSSYQKSLEPITTNYLAPDTMASSAAGHTVYVGATRHLFDLSLIYVIAGFFVVGAVVHLLAAYWRRQSYETQLKAETNQLRWVDYGLAGSLVLVSIALVSGVFDLATLVAIIGLTWISAVIGWQMERQYKELGRKLKLLVTVSKMAVFKVALILAIYIWAAGIFGSGLPRFTYWIYISLIVAVALGWGSMQRQLNRQGKWANYAYGEKVYSLLSLALKTAVAWQIFAALLHR